MKATKEKKEIVRKREECTVKHRQDEKTDENPWKLDKKIWKSTAKEKNFKEIERDKRGELVETLFPEMRYFPASFGWPRNIRKLNKMPRGVLGGGKTDNRKRKGSLNQCLKVLYVLSSIYCSD